MFIGIVIGVIIGMLIGIPAGMIFENNHDLLTNKTKNWYKQNK